MMMEVSRPPEYATTTFFANFLSLDCALRAEQTVQNCFLHVQAVFRLIVNDRTRRIHYRIGHFKPSMCRQTMQEYRVRRGQRKERLIHLISHNRGLTRGRFALLTPAGPDICVNRLRSSHGLLRRREDFQVAAGGLRDSLRM